MFDVISVTARNQSKDFFKSIEKISKSNIKAIILREKDLSESEYFQLAANVNEICKKNNTPLIIHKYISTAKKLNIRKIHLPFLDFTNLSKSENIHNEFDIVGTSVHSVDDAIFAEKNGADYLIAGHIFSTDCKKGLPPRGVEFLSKICDSVSIPVYAIGGINKNTVSKLTAVKNRNFGGVCVMSEFMKSENPEALINFIKETFINNKGNIYE